MNPLATPNLDLVPLTLALAAAERAGAEALAEALHATVPAGWPPQYYEADDLERMEGLLHDERNAGWTLYYMIRRTPERAAVGVVGFNGRPKLEGTVEIGYGVIPAYRRRGFATEAVAALLDFAYQDPSVSAVVAETFPHLPASIGVLLRTGFRLMPGAGRGGALRYRHTRSPVAAG